jgi:putative salt-induced outer membrane protein YdiY
MIFTGLSIALIALSHHFPEVVGPMPLFVPDLLGAVAAQDTAAEVKKEPHWNGTVSAGATLTRGNTDTLSAAFLAEAKREAAHDRYTLKSFWNYSEQTVAGSTSITQRNAGLNGQYDYFPGGKWYLLGKAGAETNDRANLHLRYYGGAGAGYQFVKNEKHALAGDGAIVYFKEEFSDDTEDDKVALNLGYDYDWKISPSAAFGHYVDAFPAIDDFSDVFVKVDNRLTMNLTKSMISTLQYVLDFDHTPATGTKQTDHRVIFTLGWSFGS